MSSAELAASEEADMAECDGDKVVTMMDVLQEQEDFEEDANAVLGASDEKNCTYPKGYIKRQAIYACLTCCPDAKTDPAKRAGVCLACSLSCHENHELVELYTKRNFCCDCGNSKFSSHPCQFTSDKSDLNENNSYNQNFSGLYCICHRPYPDPEADVEVEMIQCIICEDWLHATHLEAKVPPSEQYSEMVCKGCMEKNEFLYDYSDLTVNLENEDVDVDITKVSSDQVNGVCNGDSETKSDINGDVDMAEKDITEVNKNEETANDTSDLIDKPAETSVEQKETEQSAVENKEAQKVPDTIEKEKDSIVSETEKETDDNHGKEGEEITMDSNAEVKTDDSSNNTGSEKPEDQLENEKKKSTDEQSSSITDDTSESKTDNTNSDEKAKPTSEVEPDAAASNTTQDKDGKMAETETKDEGKVTLQSENEPTDKPENKQEDSIEKDDLMESIDRIINGDDDVSSELSKEKHEPNNDSDQNKPSAEEATKSSEDEKCSSEENIKESNENTDTVVNGNNSDESKLETDVNMENGDIINETSENSGTSGSNVSSNENKRKLDDDMDKVDIKKPKLDSKGCVRPKGLGRHKGATFWASNFRQKLCTCNECITMYKDLSVLFLIDLDDTVGAYELLGKEKNDGRSSQYEIGLQALLSLDRTQQINALTEYNKMRDKLLDFLKSFKDRKEVVKEEDIKAFFAGMKPKREPDGVYFCR